ncbi:glycosyltransferase [Acinetobacter sp. ANC 5378]|uniref:glycosyltransferase n=1 Tax=Acinetobacter sp. ANC 5378 TaxID=2731249 RepID=UPI00148F9534|nr:glycosyltransferase [Acinetobacter sp. ANC 5378]NNG81647.1 glycosyltransferase [Acinetobacter sp. ANC 5378]
MKILYVITGLGGGGAEKVVAALADQMQLRGHQVKIAYLKGRDIVVKPECKSVELIYLGFENLSNFIFASKKYRTLILSFKPDIVHAHMVHANIFVRLNRIVCNVPKIICTAHNANEGGKLRMAAYRFTDSLSDINTNVSVEAVEAFIQKKAFKDTAIAVYNGIDLDKFKYTELPQSKLNPYDERKLIKKILAVGRLNIQKDYPNLLQALKLIKELKKSDFKLCIVGEGEERKNIISLIHQFNLEAHVELLGRRDDIPVLISTADIFVLSSAFEGFGLVVAEAMACETFVVATDCGGVKEVMGKMGILVPPKDSMALAQALITAMEMSNADIKTNNQKGLQYVKNNFDLQVIIEKWLNLYEK